MIFSSSLSRFVVLATALSCGSLAADNKPEQEKKPNQAKENVAPQVQGLQNMKRSAAQYAISFADTPEQPFTLHDSAVMRFSNPISGTADGALYVWTHHGRPQALLKFFTFNNKTYSHALLSLSENKIVAIRNFRMVWNPDEPGIKFAEIPDAPKPEETPAGRLRQMKVLSAKFSATYTAAHLQAQPFDLRLLTQPLLRYETDVDSRADGALFGYVQSTTPVGLLLLESRPTPMGPRWHYAFTSLVTGPVAARYKDEEIFALERDAASTDPIKPFILFRSLPVPKA
jgi:hypothetical protein